MTRLSSERENLQSAYDVIVIGSGYGGAIAASRMARAGRRVCVLERGKEFQPGEYPDTLTEAQAETQIDSPPGHIGPATGLYDFRVNPDIDVFLGCGLGGTSLVNANVALRAEPRVFQDARWPAEFRNDPHLLDDHYQHAEEMLKPTPLPQSFIPLHKLEALEKSAQSLQANCYRPPINVTFSDGVNHVGVEQKACIGCGDCVTGCNFRAKNTVLMNYLPDAVNFGAEIYTEVSVRRLERDGNRWRVFYQLNGAGRELFNAPELFLTADIVMLGAGALGSTEILLRSAAAGLTVSRNLGSHFTGNGDVLGFGYNTDTEINGVGYGHNNPEGRKPVGPCITGIIDLRNQPDLNQGFVIEEGSIPGAIANILPAGLAAAQIESPPPELPDPQELLRETQRQAESLIEGAYTGAVHNTQTYLVMSHDDAAGRMSLKDDRLRIDWPGVGGAAGFSKVNQKLAEATRPLGGDYVHNPTWSPLLRHNLITVHPLGGCGMGDTADQGVVNHKGQVFSSPSGTAVYDSLYVCDGAVMPRSLGVNPLLTISAVAERVCALAAQDRGWSIGFNLPSQPKKAAPAVAAVGIQFTERMAGEWKTADAKTSPLEFTLTIISEDLDAMLADPRHRAGMTGTVTAPALSKTPLVASAAEFELFVENTAQVETRNMVYRMKLLSEEGPTYFFEGKKIIRQNSILDIWHDTSTLYITLHSGADATAPVLGQGELHIAPADFAKQMTTMQVANAQTPQQRLQAIARFGEFFAGTLYQVYGGIFARATEFNPDTPARKKRPLRVDAPELHAFQTSDGVELRLTRYRGGSKGPVMLSHGLGVSSLIFSIDTIETNLLEYLFAHGYDVWLLDFRASIDLPAARNPANGDTIATRDYPAAVAKIRAVTGADSIQAVVHCYGSTTFMMAMLAGLEGVRSAVCSQIATHVVAPTATRIKTGLHLPGFLDAIGIQDLTAYTDTHADWENRIVNAALGLYPTAAKERCNSPVCHRITFLYAPLYDHAQLNEATHESLHEMFGVANIKQFEHIALITRKGHLVSANGEDIYLNHLERLAIPICFIHGGDNECFLPESTQITYDLLRKKNGNLYSRKVVPGYGHIDCIFGKNASGDVFPTILEHLQSVPARKTGIATGGV